LPLTRRFEFVIEKYCSAGAGLAKELEVELHELHDDELNTEDIILLATEFKNLKKLCLSSPISSWPVLLTEPWTSLEELHLDHWIVSNPGLFKGVDLQMSFPNLTLLNMNLGNRGYPLLLPDLSKFEKLESFTLQSEC